MSKLICKKDKVLVIAGNDKGKTGEVLNIDGDRVLVQGINIRSKHMKARKEGEQPQILSIECPIHISNVALCSSDGKRLKTKVKVQKNGAKKLVYNEDDKEKTHRVIKKSKGK